MRRLIAPLVLAVIVVVALVATVGGDGTTGDPDRAGPAVPRLSVPRLDDGGDFDLATLASSDSPTLLWFWAPWCEVCNQEAASIERLAVDGRDDLAVVAIGGRDDAANGPAFVASHGLRTPTLLFDESMAAWEAYRIPGQPGAVLLDRGGRERARWLGAFNTREALNAARAL